ncbi:MAG: hypothetical protein NXI31_05255 [bacterium]|nr:hypothetical protein [bacterium]
MLRLPFHAPRCALIAAGFLAGAMLAVAVVGQESAQQPADSGFVAVDSSAIAAAVPVAAERIELTAELSLAIIDGDLRRTDPGGNAALPRTSPTGRVHAITRHPDGAVFAACDQGLFVCDADHLVLDLADLRDGVPPGPLRGVVADPRGRLWVCTPDAFGVIEPRFGYGRTFAAGGSGAADGLSLPPPPYRAVRRDAIGRILLQNERGWFAYRPDRGPPPRLASFAADAGSPRVERRQLVGLADGTAPFELAVVARGGVTLRQRLRHHHLLRPISEQRLRHLRPGRHQVEVHALDRDLRRRKVAEFDVSVPLPRAFDTRLLPAIAILVALLVFGLAFWTGGRPTTGPPQRLRRALVAAGRTALLMILGLQLLAATLGYGRSWPFVGFTMYTENWHEGSVLHRPRVFGLRADGTRMARELWEIGVVQDGYWQMLAEIVFGPEAKRQRFLRQINRGRPSGEPEFIGYVLADGRIRLTPAGPVDAAPTVLVRWEKAR